MKGVALLVLVGGCFSKPTPPNVTPSDADPDGDSSCVPSQPSAAGLDVDLGAAPVVRFPGNMELGFASDAATYPMPTSLTINGQQLIATPEGCNTEDQVGVAVYPAYSISGNDVPPGTSAKVLDRVIAGPAFTLLQSNWQYQFSNCSTSMTVGSGHTQWSMFPDGRIVRNDHVVPTTMGTISASAAGCACPTAGTPNYFIVTSYFAFETTQLTSVTADIHTVEATMVPAVGDTYPRSNRGCVRASGNGRVAFRWDLPFADEPNPYPTRLRQAQATAHRASVFVYDLVPDQTLMTLNSSHQFGVRTHMLLDGSGTRDCIQMTRDVNAYPVINPMRINGELVSYSALGIFDDSAITQREHTGPVTVAAMHGTIGAGFVVALKFPGFTAIRTSAQSAGVVWQRRASDDTFFIFFPETLVGNDSITITPEC